MFLFFTISLNLFLPETGLLYRKFLNKLHTQYVRLIRLAMEDFMKIYSANNNKTISVIDNSSGVPQEQSIELEKYDAKYSYFSEENKWTQVLNASAMPPFTDNMVARLELRPK